MIMKWWLANADFGKLDYSQFCVFGRDELLGLTDRYLREYSKKISSIFIMCMDNDVTNANIVVDIIGICEDGNGFNRKIYTHGNPNIHVLVHMWW